MKFETLKKDNKKKIAIGVIAVISIISVLIFARSFAKYKLTQSIPLANGTINYTVPDLNMIAIYQENDSGEYDKVNTIPSSGYTFSNESYCATLKDNSFEKNETITVNYNMDTKTISIVPITEKTRCYLYFDKIRDIEKPVISKVEATEVTKTSITVKVTATDNEGVTKYYYSINNGTYTEETTNIHTFNGLTKGTSYTIKVKAVDAAGNESEVSTTTITTENDTAGDIILAGIAVNTGTPNFSKTSCSSGCDEVTVGVYKTQDNDGVSYYYRGDVENNYLKFAGFWWRIIRINGDGTIRIIYDGTEYHANGASTSDSIAVASTKFNLSKDDNAYVGFMYGTEGSTTYETTHTNTNKSTIMTALETWYINNLANYANKIDINAGFCGARSRSTSKTEINNTGGIGTTTTYYGAYVRLIENKTPNLGCTNSNDLYTTKGATRGNKAMDKPIGLITADEMVMAGAVVDKTNESYYLYNSKRYWTMTPGRYNNHADVISSDCYDTHYNRLGSFGFALATGGSVSSTTGGNNARPVINLRADVELTGSGTGEDPFIVVGTE